MAVNPAAEPTTAESRPAQDRSVAQTLSRGIQILEVLADAGQPLTAQQLAQAIGVSRPIVYRLLRTLELHDLIDAKTHDGKFDVSSGLLTLARKTVRTLREAALPELWQLTHDHHATSFIGVREGEEILCLLSQEPVAHALAIRHREGMRVPLLGATSYVLLSTEPATPNDPAAVVAARQDGYAVSESQVFPGAVAVSAPIFRAGNDPDASVTLVFSRPEQIDRDRAIADITAAAARISHAATL